MNGRRTRSALPMLAAVAFLTTMVVAVLLHNMIIGSRITRLLTPQVEAVTQIQLRTTRAHLRIEESLAGVRTAPLAPAWLELDEARRLGSVLVGEAADDIGLVRELAGDDAMAATGEMLRRLDEFRALAEARVAARGDAGPGSEIDQKLDAVFEEFNRDADVARTTLENQFGADVARFRAVQQGMVAFATLLAVAVAVGFVRLHRQTGRALTEARRWSDELELVHNVTPISMAVLDRELRFLRVNRQAAAMSGRPVWDHPGRLVSEITPWFPAEALELCRQVLGSGEAILNREVHMPTGETPNAPRDLLVSISPVEITGVEGPCLVVTAQDLTPLRAAEAALQQSEAKLRTIIENSTNMFYSHTTDHRLTFVSPQVREILDAEPEEAMVKWTDFVTDHPVNDEGFAITQRAIDTGERQPTYELQMRSLTGRLVWVEVREAPVVVDGKVTAIVGALADITKRKDLTEQLLQSQKLEAVGRLAGGVAHDFNNILQAIFGQISLLKGRLPGTSEVRPLVMGLQASADRASELTRQLLAFSRRQVLRPEPVDLGVLLGGTLEMLQRLVGEEMEIRFTAPADLWTVLADPGQMQQVLTNLVVNARDAMDGRGQAAVRVENHPADDEHEFDRVLLEVADDGVGMDEEIVEHIFEPFFTTKGQAEGTGLGLSTVYGIVQQHRGSVEVESAPSHGTTFRVWLRRHFGPPAAGDQPTTSPGRLSGGRETILLAEDEDEVRSLTCEVLTEAGYRVIAASDGRDAIRLFDQEPAAVDLAVLDVVMPHVGGSEVARHVRAQRPDLGILFTSGYSEEFIEGRLAIDGDYQLIQKPYRLRALLSSVRRLLDEGPAGSSN
jgi:two-component system cell cycle sensor histidine kinase/response regulator CckA